MANHHQDERTLPERETWEQLQALLANCLRHPDAGLERAIEDGSLHADLSRMQATVGMEPAASPPQVADRDLTEDYEALFGAFRTPFAPPAASPYKEWYEDHDGGLMEGPPATAMERRYAAMDAVIPEAYPADHVALELEYASILTEADELGELAKFVHAELDWIDAFQRLVEAAAAEAPFHRWAVQELVRTLDRLRAELDIPQPTEEAIDRMAGRARNQIE